ncbi:hypothetical protein [Draconibacterium sp.]|uniref:helix-turn-helix transcriptional regulator n=1 Tax=Draconibacterium sp. TaxID=1965318 RepID=UPI003564EACA
METKLLKNRKIGIIPAGIVDGTEPFWFNNEKWVLHNGMAMKFDEAPGAVQRMIADACRNDKRSLSIIHKMGAKGFTAEFETWYKCVVGGLDAVPDFKDGKFTPDAYNNVCNDYDCPMRGKLCSVATGLRSHDVKTIIALKRGKSIAATADDLCISTAGMKSRVEKLKEQLGAPNMASLMARATEIGI